MIERSIPGKSGSDSRRRKDGRGGNSKIGCLIVSRPKACPSPAALMHTRLLDSNALIVRSRFLLPSMPEPVLSLLLPSTYAGAELLGYGSLAIGRFLLMFLIGWGQGGLASRWFGRGPIRWVCRLSQGGSIDGREVIGYRLSEHVGKKER